MSRETCGVREKSRDISDRGRSLKNHGVLRKMIRKTMRLFYKRRDKGDCNGYQS